MEGMEKKYKVNDQITSRVVSVVLPDGSTKTNISIGEAMDIAGGANLDLVEVSKGENSVPVCKLTDYGKMMYHQSKKNKLNSHVQRTKEIKYGYNISSHDLDTKHNRIKEFLLKKYIVRYSLELKGREKNLIDDAVSKFNHNLSKLSDDATWKDVTVSRGGRIVISTTLQLKQ